MSWANESIVLPLLTWVTLSVKSLWQRYIYFMICWKYFLKIVCDRKEGKMVSIESDVSPLTLKKKESYVRETSLFFKIRKLWVCLDIDGKISVEYREVNEKKLRNTTWLEPEVKGLVSFFFNRSKRFRKFPPEVFIFFMNVSKIILWGQDSQEEGRNEHFKTGEIAKYASGEPEIHWSREIS